MYALDRANLDENNQSIRTRGGHLNEQRSVG